MPGRVASAVEVVRVTPFGIWIAHGERESFLDHDMFPWFRDAPVRDIVRVEEISPGHFHRPALDVDLDRIEHPERYPLAAKM